MKDIRKLRLLARRLLQRGAHLKLQTDRCWLSLEVCRPGLRTGRLTIALSGFECASLLWIYFNRLKAVQAEIKRRKRGE